MINIDRETYKKELKKIAILIETVETEKELQDANDFNFEIRDKCNSLVNKLGSCKSILLFHKEWDEEDITDSLSKIISLEKEVIDMIKTHNTPQAVHTLSDLLA